MWGIVFKKLASSPSSTFSGRLGHVCSVFKSLELICVFIVLCSVTTSILFDRGIRRSQLEVEPSQPVALEGLSDSGSPVRLRFKTIKLQSGSSQCTPLHAALPPALRVCLCCTEVFFTFKEKKEKKKGLLKKKMESIPWCVLKPPIALGLARRQEEFVWCLFWHEQQAHPPTLKRWTWPLASTDLGDQARTLTEL